VTRAVSKPMQWLQGRIKKGATWSVGQARASVTSWRRMLVTIVIVVVILAALDVLLALVRTGVEVLITLASDAIGAALVHLELHQDWFALGGALLIILAGILAAMRALRAVRRPRRPLP
jgi:hypothetical protein